MATVTFDTHKFVRKLKASGFDDQQAEALTDVIQAAIGEGEMVTGRDLQIALAPILADLSLLKWMISFLLAGVGALIIKLFIFLGAH